MAVRVNTSRDGERSDESLIDALKRTTREATLLLRQEFELAKAEISLKLRGLGLGAGFLIVAALLAVGSLATLSACLILALSLVVAPWLAALAVTILYLIGAAVLGLVGRRYVSRAIPPVPDRTIRNATGEFGMAKDPSKIEDAMKATRDRLGDAIDNVVAKSDVSARVSDTINETANALKKRLAEGADTFGREADTARERLPDGTAVRSGARDPVALVVGAAAVGFIAGLVIPLSEIERVRLEPLGNDLAARVTEARNEIVEQGRAVVVETVSAARGSVQKHGDELAGNLGVDAGATVAPSKTDRPKSG